MNLEEPVDYDPRPDFKPIIELPDEIELKTGEENEIVLFQDRCKLFRFDVHEWKERGIGKIKILKNKDSNKCRIVMRREQIHKLCANHAITPEMILKPTEKENQMFWGANDFSDGQMQLEKFLVRFKHVDQIVKFKDVFDQAVKIVAKDVAIPKTDPSTKVKEKVASTPVLTFGSPAVVSSAPAFSSITPKSTFSFGGLTGNLTTQTTPTITPKETKKDSGDKEKAQVQSSPFANFTFGQGSNKSFSELFSNISTNKADSSTDSVSQSTPVVTNLNKSGHDVEEVDHYEPNVQFEPVIPLPDLVDTKTGEEDEDVIFGHRAKLLRFDAETKEWKERGIGEMKVLVNKADPNKCRLLMRREQIYKLCCNMIITPDLKFTKMNPTSLMFGGQDFSENEMRTEKLAIKFKTSELIQSFHDAVLGLQKNLNTKTEPQKKQSEKKTEEKGFGSQFKPKVGSWTCEGCYISNKPEALYCVACDSPKDITIPKKDAKSVLDMPADAPKFSFGMPGTGFSFGTQPATTTSAPPSTVTAELSFGSTLSSQPSAISSTGFTFGVPKQAVIENKAPIESNKKVEGKGFGDQFKPKAGSWACEACYINNKGDTLYCVACDSPKDNTVPKKEAKSVLDQPADAPKFSFGMPGTGFSFGTQSATTVSAVSSTVVSSTVVSSDAVTSSTTSASGFSFGAPKSFSFGMNSIAKIDEKPVEPVAEPTVELGNDKPGFNFVFKKKSPSKVKSPHKARNDSMNSEGAVEEDGNEYHEEEENQTYFTPVIPLPDKVEIKTGEENEEIIYSHRAKLFRYIEKEWKERGVGDVKILKHRVTGSLRVIMRRDQILKLCLNFFLTDEIEFKRMEDKAWTFGANDFSDGEFEPTSFAIRFKNKDITDDFKKAIDNALSEFDAGAHEDDTNADILKRLMLPKDFFGYENLPNCSGCIGCNPDDYVFPTLKSEVIVDSNPLPLELPAVNIKRKPKAPTTVGNNISRREDNEAEKVKALFGVVQKTSEKEKANIFGGGIRKSEGLTDIFAAFNSESPAITPNKLGNLFGNKDEVSSSGETSIFSSSLNTTPAPVSSAASTVTESKLAPTFSEPNLDVTPSGSLFGNKTSFSFNNPTNGSAFGSGNKENGGTSIFGSGNNQPVFGSTNIFGGGSLTFGSKPEAPVFGATSSVAKTFSFAEAAKDLNQPQDMTKPVVVPDFLKKNNDSGGFAALAAVASPEKGFLSTGSAEIKPTGGFFGLTVKEDIFTKLANKKNDSEADTSQNDGENATDDHFDPHYEPIISLPEEIKVSTGEEDEDKLFNERAKLYRYDAITKEWKERGVGEIKILHHPVNGTYRLLLRREQIFKLVLNQLISPDLHLAPMDNSPKAFCWAGMNYAEGAGEAEQLAIRFKNEDLASKFKTHVDECLSKLESRENLKPEND